MKDWGFPLFPPCSDISFNQATITITSFIFKEKAGIHSRLNDARKGVAALKPEKLYQELKDLAGKLGITVSEQNFRNTGIHVKSGHCKVKEIDHCIINKHLKLNKKIEVMGECLSLFPHESVYTVPAVREFLESFKPVRVAGEVEGEEAEK
jgi:hypothetical protein